MSPARAHIAHSLTDNYYVCVIVSRHIVWPEIQWELSLAVGSQIALLLAEFKLAVLCWIAIRICLI